MMQGKLRGIVKHPVTFSLGTIFAIIGLVFTVVTYFDGKYVTMSAFNLHVDSQKINNTDFKKFEHIIEINNASAVRKEIKNAEINELMTKKMALLSIPISDRDSDFIIRMAIIDDELKTLHIRN